jgi:hypothetical protein
LSKQRSLSHNEHESKPHLKTPVISFSTSRNFIDWQEKKERSQIERNFNRRRLFFEVLEGVVSAVFFDLEEFLLSCLRQKFCYQLSGES